MGPNRSSLPSSFSRRHRVDTALEKRSSNKASAESTSQTSRLKLSEVENASSVKRNELKLLKPPPPQYSNFSANLPTSWNHRFPPRSETLQAPVLVQDQVLPRRVPTALAPHPCVGPYDICELHVYSLHRLKSDRETLRILGVGAGETLHNIYRVIMTALDQREDRARLVFHAWVLPDGRVYGYGPKYKAVIEMIGSDRSVCLNELPLCFGYQMIFVFGMCVYAVIVQDILSGLTTTQDIIWTPRVCEGSYGEPVPFDLCFTPHLFAVESAKPSTETCVPSLESAEAATDGFIPASQFPTTLRPKHAETLYLTSSELDAINVALSKMRFIRHNSNMRVGVRRLRSEDIALGDDNCRKYYRMLPRQFFCTLWYFQLMKLQQAGPDSADAPPLHRRLNHDQITNLNTLYSMQSWPAFTNKMMSFSTSFPRCRFSARPFETKEYNKASLQSPGDLTSESDLSPSASPSYFESKLNSPQLEAGE